MTEERLREIANSYLRCTSMDMAKSLDDTIRLALAERDREVAEWVKELRKFCHLNAAEALTANDRERQMAKVAVLDGLLAFLEAQP